jgi:hypothetical protein
LRFGFCCNSLLLFLVSVLAKGHFHARAGVAPTGGRPTVLAWRISASQGVLMTTAYWAVFAAALGYCVAIFYSPTLGQLIGIYITGPLGLIVGGTCGVIHGLWHKAKMPLRPMDGGG